VADPEINELGRRQILAAAEKALKNADVLGVVPTPLEQLAERVSIAEIIDVSDLPEDLVAKKPSALRKILGAYLMPAKTIFVDRAMSEGRVRFTTSHELGHRIIPWHDGAFVDDERRLFRDSEELLETEANLAAAHIIFQAQEFFDRARSFPVSIQTPILLADEFKASLHAAIRYYIEHHHEAVAGLICGQYPRMDGTIPIYSAIESSKFRAECGPMWTRFPNAGLPINRDHAFASLIADARSGGDATKAIDLLDLNRERRQFTAEGFFNTRSYFVMIVPKTRLRSGRRIRLATS
jgi:Zn-dependent peptidase ImmA (M78 family)